MERSEKYQGLQMKAESNVTMENSSRGSKVWVRKYLLKVWGVVSSARVSSSLYRRMGKLQLAIYIYRECFIGAQSCLPT